MKGVKYEQQIAVLSGSSLSKAKGLSASQLGPCSNWEYTLQFSLVPGWRELFSKFYTWPGNEATLDLQDYEQMTDSSRAVNCYTLQECFAVMMIMSSCEIPPITSLVISYMYII